ncbi:ArsR/SmtB family transcription factor [Streptomyces sp. NBC_00859]|uniref:ArsR/SmtB family transcription factor n=1 Tax=Streptomyces sp. NBC_00859 TaxID=2903682 RepID=UPI0038678BA6|nr:helix-turn-helix domain-containing protein [Streptomyces sp. NBC_00859]
MNPREASAAAAAALADPHRRRVVAELAVSPEDERLCSTFDLPVSKSTRTHHWRVLREAGLVQQRDAGNRLYMRLRKDELQRRFPGLVELVPADARSALTPTVPGAVSDPPVA